MEKTKTDKLNGKIIIVQAQLTDNEDSLAQTQATEV